MHVYDKLEPADKSTCAAIEAGFGEATVYLDGFITCRGGGGGGGVEKDSCARVDNCIPSSHANKSRKRFMRTCG